MRNYNCEKYDLCLEEAAKRNLKELPCEGCENMSNFLKPEKVKQVVAHIEKGDGIRKTSRETGVAKNTVTNIQRVIIAERIEKKETLPLCGCGRPAGHKGWCSYRLAESPKRQKFLINRGKLSFDDIAKKYIDFLEKKKDLIDSEIKKLMAESIRTNTRLCFLEEYLGCISIDGEPDKKLAEEYIDILIDVREDEKPTRQ